MRQKFIVSMSDTENRLIIREYAVIGKHQKNKQSFTGYKGDYSLLCQESYNREDIETSISKGKKALIATLRTTNLYPIETQVAKIAESVIALYRSDENLSTELFFDDVAPFIN